MPSFGKWRRFSAQDAQLNTPSRGNFDITYARPADAAEWVTATQRTSQRRRATSFDPPTGESQNVLSHCSLIAPFSLLINYVCLSRPRQ